MPGLLSHATVGLFIRSRARRSALVWFVVGSCLPDLASRLPGLGLALAAWLVEFEVPLPVLEATGLCHNPLPYLVLCGLVTLCLPMDLRRVAGINLAAGGLLHLGLDTAQSHLNGGYYLLYPFSLERFELGLIESDASLTLLPYLLLGAVVLLGWKLWRSSGNRPGGRAAGGST